MFSSGCLQNKKHESCNQTNENKGKKCSISGSVANKTKQTKANLRNKLFKPSKPQNKLNKPSKLDKRKQTRSN